MLGQPPEGCRRKGQPHLYHLAVVFTLLSYLVFIVSAKIMFEGCTGVSLSVGPSVCLSVHWLLCSFVFIPLLRRRGGAYLFRSVCPSIGNQYFLSVFSATMHHSHFKLGMLPQLGVLQVAYRIQVCQFSTSCFTTSFIIRHSLCNQYFPSHFLSNHASQPL